MRARGFSIVEFMIAITIGLFLIAGLVYLIAETSRSRAEIERSSRQIENGRYALERLSEDIRHAGFFSEYYSMPAAGEAGFPATLTAANPCATTIASLTTGIPLAVQAYDGTGSVPSDLSTCLSAADYSPNTDILVVRRASTARFCATGKTCCAATPVSPYTSPACVPAMVTDVVATGSTLTTGTNIYQPFIQATATEYKLDIGQNAATFTLTRPSANTTTTVDAPVRKYIVRIYFIAKCNTPSTGNSSDPCDAGADGGSPIPTLKMLELAGGAGAPQFNKLSIAEGIENMQFDFGIDSTGDGVADTVSMCDSSSPCTAVNFSNVVTVQVNLVARNAETSPSYTDDKTYNLGLKGFTTATNDHYRRHSYSALVRLNNIAMRRE